jgi:hypothetical protein
MLTACAWCERVRLGDRWVDAVRAIAHLRTYEWKLPPRFTHGICDTCLAEQLAKRKHDIEPRPQTRVLDWHERHHSNATAAARPST